LGLEATGTQKKRERSRSGSILIMNLRLINIRWLAMKWEPIAERDKQELPDKSLDDTNYQQNAISPLIISISPPTEQAMCLAIDVRANPLLSFDSSLSHRRSISADRLE
jgi:hypothetical protein